MLIFSGVFHRWGIATLFNWGGRVRFYVCVLCCVQWQDVQSWDCGRNRKRRAANMDWQSVPHIWRWSCAHLWSSALNDAFQLHRQLSALLYDWHRCPSGFGQCDCCSPSNGASERVVGTRGRRLEPGAPGVLLALMLRDCCLVKQLSSHSWLVRDWPHVLQRSEESRGKADTTHAPTQPTLVITLGGYLGAKQKRKFFWDHVTMQGWWGFSIGD